MAVHVVRCSPRITANSSGLAPRVATPMFVSVATTAGAALTSRISDAMCMAMMRAVASIELPGAGGPETIRTVRSGQPAMAGSAAQTFAGATPANVVRDRLIHDRMGVRTALSVTRSVLSVTIDPSCANGLSGQRQGRRRKVPAG
jgi:hypothetical protein